MESTREELREPVVAGVFYPAEKRLLMQNVADMLENATGQEVSGQVVGLIAPHAGYVYSGAIAASVFRLVQTRRFDNVIVISPSHFEYFYGCSVFLGTYRTPIGDVRTNQALTERLIEKSTFVTESLDGHTREHGLEVMLPFLQVVAEDFQLVPVVMGIQDMETAKELSEAIVSTLKEPPFKDQNTLLIASSDLSHYHSADAAKKLDAVVIDAVNGFDADKLNAGIASGECEACGPGPMMTVLMAARALGATRSKVISYGSSGDVNHDYEEVVGYLSAVLWAD